MENGMEAGVTVYSGSYGSGFPKKRHHHYVLGFCWFEGMQRMVR